MKKETTQTDAQKFIVPEKKEKKEKIPKNAIKIVAYDGDIGGLRELATFYAHREEKKEDKTTYLVHSQYNFMIPIPDSEREDNTLDITTITTRLAELEEEIKSEMTSDTPDINDKDLIDERQQLLKQLRVLLYEKNSGYWGISGNGIPFLAVHRKGNTWHPLKWDLTSNTIYTPSNTRLADTRNSETNKRMKYGALSSLTTIGIIFIVTSFLMFGTGVWTWYKAFQTLEETSNIQNMAELMETCTIGIKENNEEIKKGIIEGVTEAVLTEQTDTKPKGAGG